MVTKKDEPVTTEENTPKDLDTASQGLSQDDGEPSPEEIAAKEEEERKERMSYASQVADRHGANETPFVESEEDWFHANRLIADGLAKLHAEQTGIEVRNYLVLTPEGEGAVQAYNAETE